MKLNSRASLTRKKVIVTAAVLTVVELLAWTPGGAAAQAHLAAAQRYAHPDSIGTVGAGDGSAVKVDPEYLGDLLTRYLESTDEYRQFLIDTTEPAVMVKVLAALQKMGEEQLSDYRARLTGKCSRR
jgi:endonuclease YncB( thermonuclease family)